MDPIFRPKAFYLYGVPVIAASLLALQLTFSTAVAQTASGDQNPTAAAPPSLEEVQVTASRIQNSPYEAPSPVAEVSALEIQQQAITQTINVLKMLPEENSLVSPQNSGNNIQDNGAAEADLRDLGGNRTLVLVNSQRFMPTTIGTDVAKPAGAVDLNMIPSSLIQRVDVVTGGASASWGSDAVAGVVNIILNNDLVGTRLQAEYSATQYNDGNETQFSIDHGQDFADGRGHFVVAAEYLDNAGVPSCTLTSSRSWCSPYNIYQTVSNPTPGVNGYPARVFLPNGTPYLNIIPNAPPPSSAIGGIVPTGPLAGYAFDKNSNPYKFVDGSYQPFAGPTTLAIANQGGGLAPAIGHDLLYGHVSYDVTDTVRATLDMNYAYVRSMQYGAPPIWSGSPVSTNTMHICNNPGPTKSADGYCAAGEVNAYLTPATTALMSSAGLVDLPVNFEGTNFGYPLLASDRNLVRIVPSLNGSYKLFGNDWVWNAYDQYADSLFQLRAYGADNIANFDAASHAVTVTSTNVGSSGLALGSIACQSTLSNPKNGCVPVNYMGNIAPSAAALGYLEGTLFNDTRQTENVAALSTSGNLFNLPAGPVSSALGVEYRINQISTAQDPVTAASGWVNLSVPAANGSVNVKEAFLEGEVPLLKDIPGFELLSAELAGRITDYSTSGTVHTWKVGFVDNVNSVLRLRATLSSDIRAPDLYELYSTRATQNATVSDPVTHNGNDTVEAIVGGNPNLKPEDARTITAGFVVNGPGNSIWENFTASLDYYEIDISNAITAGIGTQQAVTSCYQGISSACALVPRDSYGNIIDIVDSYVNFNREDTAGWDLKANFHHQMGPGVGSVALSVNHVFLYDLISGLGAYTNNIGVQSLNSTIGGERAWTSNTTFNYTMPDKSVGLRVYWFGNGYNSATLIGPGQPGYSPYLANSETWNSLPGAAYLYLNGTYDIWKRGDQSMQLYAAIDNLLNKSPPYVANGTNAGFNLFPVYDVYGRLFHVGIRAKL